MVENPIIATYVDEVLKKIEIKAREEDLPIFVRKTVPKLEDSFWVNVIGKGYPVPNTAFRWCTEKLKIKPTARFIIDQVDECGEAIILIGTRKAESATRARSIKKHEIHGKRLTNHTNSPEDSIPAVHKIHYTLEDINGISAKGGGNGDVTIFYSTRHIEKSFAANDTAKLFFETRGVLLHELTHAYQLEPQGIGSYGTNRVFWAFIEGMADAVRVANGGFDGPNARPKGGNYMDGYRTAGYFFVWLRDNKDPEFLRKFNRSTLEVIPWSFDGAIKHVLGDEYNIDELWHEYQVAVGDIQA